MSQIMAPLPRWGGKTNPGVMVGQRADADLIDWSKNPEGRREGVKYVAALQDRASRYLWTRPLETKSARDVTRAYREMFAEARRDGMEPPQELNGDLEAAFKSAEFQNMLRDQDTVWRPKTGTKRENLGNTAQLDSTIGRWREALRRERGGSERWFDFIPSHRGGE